MAQPTDIDQNETQEWLAALESLVEFEGTERAQFILQELLAKAQGTGVPVPTGTTTPYINTIPATQEQPLPEGDAEKIEKLMALIRWNAAAMVTRAGQKASELGGHIASYASAAHLYEVGFHYFFKARAKDHPGDLVFIQGHSSPGIYARAFLEGRISREQLDGFRQDIAGPSVTSYPHPWLMPDFWQFATVSMGIGALTAIYQAHFLKYLENRGLVDNKDRKVWCFCGDGEMDEPESLGAIGLPGREHLDNLIFVINCNLQRLDGPVRGNSKIVQELEGHFRGAGWHVIKVIWGSMWDELLAKDTHGLLVKRMNECVDGEVQAFEAHGGAYFREHFFGKYPELLELVKDKTDEELAALNDGGHDLQKVYTAYKAAAEHEGQPVVILAKTIKGYGMGAAGEGLNTAHNQKKMDSEQLKAYRDRFGIPVTDKQIEKVDFCLPNKNNAELKFLLDQRKKLGGFLPARHSECERLYTPSLEVFDSLLQDSDGREFSTTMAFVRALSTVLKDKGIGKHVVPVVADESRTFGMEGLFRTVGIYSPWGQLYEPVDRKQVMYYREAKDGQLLQEGLTEAGAFSSWLAAATSYSVSGVPMIPFYIYYSMFGYQRIGDFIWAAADMRARGFLIGGTAGRTTLAGEGLQHQDGHNLLMFGMVPTCRSYDPCFAYEMAVIIQYGLQRMYAEQVDEFYYLTATNENYTHPAMPKNAEEGIIKGMYLFKESKAAKQHVQLLGSGTILREVIAAAGILEKDYGVTSDIWSVTSFNELHKDMNQVRRKNRLHDDKSLCYVEQCLQDREGPVIAATDYLKLYADQIRAAVHHDYYVLGTDGFGRSDTRKHLRHHFEVDVKSIVYTTLYAIGYKDLTKAVKELGIDVNKVDPLNA